MSASTFDNRLARLVDVRLNSKEFAELLKRLETNLIEVRGKILTLDEVKSLKDYITTAVLVYYGLANDGVDNTNLHEAVEPIGQLIGLLTRTANVGNVLVALGAPTPLWLISDNDRNLKNAENRHKRLISDLAKIAVAASKSTPKRNRGGQFTTRDIRGCADVLAICWRMLSNEPFAQSWIKDEAKSKPRKIVWVPSSRCGGAAFVHEVIKFLAPDRPSSQVKSVTEDLVTLRNNAKKQVSRK